MAEPIACSLTAAAAETQLAEWRDIFATSVREIERPEPCVLRLRLAPATDLATLLALARREVDCCPFFVLSIELDALGMFFVARVPPDGVPILDAFAELAVPA